MNKIYVLDLETTGLEGYPKDKVLEVGIASLDFESGCIEKCYSQIVHQPLSDGDKDAWIFSNSTLKAGDIQYDVDETRNVARYLRYRFGDKLFTAYNTDFDFGTFLWSNEWQFSPYLAPDIMVECRDVVPDRSHAGLGRFPSAWNSYRYLCPSNPLNLSRERHRALDDAVLECYILRELISASDVVHEHYKRAVLDWKNEDYLRSVGIELGDD